MTRNFLQAAGSIFVLFLVFAILDKADKTFMSWQAYRAWVADACEPKHPGQLAVSRIRDGKLQCQIQENYGYGRVPTIVSDATMEIPQ